MIALLDVNVLIALLDPQHVHHDPAHHWFAEHSSAGWATCPLTQNGVLRILGHPRYPNRPGSPATVMPLLIGLLSLPTISSGPNRPGMIPSSGCPRRIHWMKAPVRCGKCGDVWYIESGYEVWLSTLAVERHKTGPRDRFFYLKQSIRRNQHRCRSRRRTGPQQTELPFHLL